MARKLANFSYTTLNGTINNSTTTVVVTSASLFPATGNFTIRIDDELMLVTNRSGNTFTVTRNVESTSAASHTTGANVYGPLTLAALEEYILEYGTGITLSGELGGTIATATVDATHSGSPHHPQAHNLFSADHTGDLTHTDTPADNDLLQFDSGTGKWNAEPAANHGSHGGGGGGRTPYKALVYRSSGTQSTAIQADGTVISGPSTNHATVINAAITYVAANGGGDVFISAGDYTITSSIVVVTNVDLNGEGQYGRTDSAPSSGHARGTRITTTTAGLVMVDVSGYGSRVKNISIDGQNTGTTIGVRLRAGDSAVQFCGIFNCATGVQVSTDSGPNAFFTGQRVEHCVLDHNNTLGILVDSGVTDGRIHSCWVLHSASASRYAIELLAGGWTVDGECHITESSSGSGGDILIDGGNCKVIGNYMDTNGTFNINVTGGGGGIIAGNFIKPGSGGRTACIQVGGGWMLIYGNTFSCNASARWAIRYTSASPKGMCFGNSSFDHATGTTPFDVVGSSTNARIPNGFYMQSTTATSTTLSPRFMAWGNNMVLTGS